jgi:hypothetical protein
MTLRLDELAQSVRVAQPEIVAGVASVGEGGNLAERINQHFRRRDSRVAAGVAAATLSPMRSARSGGGNTLPARAKSPGPGSIPGRRSASAARPPAEGRHVRGHRHTRDHRRARVQFRLLLSRRASSVDPVPNHRVRLLDRASSIGVDTRVTPRIRATIRKRPRRTTATRCAPGVQPERRSRQ